ncbi:MAG: TlyA family RNA methyltransferase [Anaerolineae bacterium]
MPKERIARLLVERGLVESRERGRRLIMAGEVFVDGQLVTKPGTQIPSGAAISLKAKPRFVSRGGDILLGALQTFAIDPTGWVCADVGASTGGITDCLLQHGAARVYAIDVGYGQLAWKLRQDERVVNMERTNARHLESLPEPVDFVVADASFISLALLMPAFTGWMKPAAQAVLLIKPQFEAGKEQVGKGGVVRDSDVHRQVLADVAATSLEHEFALRGLIPSPLRGPAGNVEFLLWLSRQGPPAEPAALIETALAMVSDSPQSTG